LRLKIVRRLSLEEVKKRLQEHEIANRMPFSEFEKQFIEGKVDPGLFGKYVEWADLLHAYEAYVEGGELDYVVEETWRMKPEELEKMLNPRRLEPLEMISGSHIESINDVARKVGRNVRNVYDDLKLLEKKGFLHF
jgi:hypothetical protein